MLKIRQQCLSSFGKHDYAYIIYYMHMNIIRIHSYLVADNNEEKNTNYGYQTEASGDSGRKIMIV